MKDYMKYMSLQKNDIKTNDFQQGETLITMLTQKGGYGGMFEKIKTKRGKDETSNGQNGESWTRGRMFELIKRRMTIKRIKLL